MDIRTLGLGLVATALLGGTSYAADLYVPATPEPIMASAPAFDWSGPYVGVHGGAQFAGNTNGVIGAVAGINFMVADPILLGLEVQGDYVWHDDFSAGEFLALGRVGAVVTDQVMVYAAAGLGYRDTNNNGPAEGGIYAFGGGVEFAATDAISVRAEVLGEGFLGDGNNGNNEPVAAKATVGVLYNF